MALSVKIFNGKLNMDVHPYRVPQGDYLDALNITRDAESNGQDQVVSNINGNTQVSYNNIFGALIAGDDLTSSEKATVLNNLNAKYGRLPIFLSSFSGTNAQYDAYTSAGIIVVLNINNQPVVGDVPNPYPTDLVAYAASINNVLDAYSPELVVIENEELNEAYFTGTPQQYIDMLNVAIPICHARGIKVTNGGLLYAPIASLIYWEFVDAGLASEASDFLLNNVPSAYWARFQNPLAHPDWVTYVDGFKTVIDYYATSDLDYVNFHIYEPANVNSADDTVSQPAPDAINFTVQYLKDHTNKEVISNEIGQKNINADLTTNIMNLIVSNGLKYAIWYSGDSFVGAMAKALTESDGTLRVTGMAFADFIVQDSFLPLGVNKVIGGKEDLIRNRHYTAIWNSNGNNLITYYDGNLNLIVKVLESKTDSDGVDILEFDPSIKIHSWDILNRDAAQGDIHYFIDSLQRPSQINILKAINGEYGVWQRSFLDAAKEPPSLPPKVIFEDDVTVTVNNFKKRLFKFRHRFVFENNEKSVYSAESEIPLPYDIGNPDFDTDPTHNARISIIVETGALNVKKIELVGAVSIGNTFSDYFLIDVLDKEELSIEDNSTTIFIFYNDKQYPTVDINEIIQPYDYVPKKANTQGMANGNTLEYGGITEGYDKIAINADVDTALDDDAVFQYPKSILYASQTGQGIKITVLGTIQDNDVFNIYTTNEAFQYVANAGDFTSDVIFGLRDAAIAIGFTVVLTNADTWVILTKAGETFELYFEIPATPADFTDVTPAYDWLSKNSFGLVYFDEKGREMGGVLTSDALTASMPINSTANELPYVDLTINHRPPLDARYYEIVRSKDLAKLSILQWVTDRAFKDDKYAYVSIASLNQFIVDNPGTGTQLGYTFTPGDRIRFMQFIWDGVPQSNYGTVLDFEILASVQNPIINGLQQTGQILKIALPTGSLSNFFNFGNIEITAGIFKDFENYFVEIYTPSKPIGDNLNVYYEFGEKYDILDAGTADRRHQGMLINQSADLSIPAYFRFKKGDYYYRIRDINVGNELKYTIQEVGSGVDELDIFGMSLQSQTFTAAGYIVQSTVYGDYSGNLNDSNNWFIQITDGAARSFTITGNITIKSINSSSSNFDIKVYATNSGATVFFPIATATAPIPADKIFNFSINTTFTVPAGYTNVYLLFITPDFSFEASILSGNLIITETALLFTVNVIDKNFSDYFLSSVNSNGRSWAIEPNAKEEYNPVKIRFSQEFDQDTNTNGLNRFYEDNFVEIDRSAADIQRLFVDGRQLYAFQKFNVGVIPILMQIVKDVSGNPLEANSDLLLNKVAYPFTGKYGIGDAPCSLSYGKGKFFFVDTNKKIVCGFVRGGDIEPLSVIYDTNSFFVQNLAAYRKDFNNGYPATGQPYTGDADIYGIFNRYTNKYILALEEINRYDIDGNLIFHQDAKTISFSIPENGQAKGFESPYSYHPEWLGNLGTLLIAFKDGAAWTHNNPVYCNFFGVQYECYIVAAFNEHGMEKKSWIGLTETASEIWDCPEITTQVNTYGKTPQSSRLPAARFTLQEGEFAASLLRDVNSYGGLINGAFLKGNYMIVKFRIPSASNFVFLNAVGVKYNISKLVAV